MNAARLRGLMALRRMQLSKPATPAERFTLLVTHLLILTLLPACGAARQRLPPEATEQTRSPATSSATELGETFEEVWKTINEEYYDPTFRGVDWQAVHDRYLPRAKAATSDGGLTRVIEGMLSELRDAHTSYSPLQPQVGENTQPAGSIGISLGEAEGKVVILEVEPDSDAARASVKPGMVLRTVNGKGVEQLFAEIRSEFVGSSSERSMKSVMLGAILYGGFLGTERTLGVMGFDDKLFEVKVTRRSVSPPPLLVARRLASGYGYIKFGAWQPPVDERFQTELAKLMDTPGLVIDLRGNGGGSRDVAWNIASNFFAAPVSCGANKKRSGGVESYSTHKPDQVYKGAVVILVDEATASASELFSVVMQEHGRAKVIGRQTCGCALNGNQRKMKAGGTLRWSYRIYTSPRGRILEGSGVVPDETVALTIADLRRGRDAALQAAENKLRVL